MEFLWQFRRHAMAIIVAALLLWQCGGLLLRV